MTLKVLNGLKIEIQNILEPNYIISLPELSVQRSND